MRQVQAVAVDNAASYIRVGSVRIVKECPSWFVANPIAAGSRIRVAEVKAMPGGSGAVEISFQVNGGGYRTMTEFYVRNYTEAVPA